jgi:hypothetical protein
MDGLHWLVTFTLRSHLHRNNTPIKIHKSQGLKLSETVRDMKNHIHFMIKYYDKGMRDLLVGRRITLKWNLNKEE